MAGQFFILVDKRDSEKFRKFKIKKFSEMTDKILEKHKHNFIWSFHKSQITDIIWNQIKKNDFVYFTIPKNNFEITAKISKKMIDKKMGKLMWPDSLNSEQLTHFLLFDKLESVNLPFSEIVDYSVEKLIAPLPGIYKIKNNFKLQSKKSNQTTIYKKFSIPKPFVMPTTKTNPAQKNILEVTRFVRDSIKVKKLKKLYFNKCQICGDTFEYKNNKFYSEVHHYNPLEENGNDDIDNMIVVCPNHHSKFDYKVIAIDTDLKSIIDKKGEKIAEIYFHKGHTLSEKNILSQLRSK